LFGVDLRHVILAAVVLMLTMTMMIGWVVVVVARFIVSAL